MSLTSILLKLASLDSYLQFKAFVTQFCQLVLSFYHLTSVIRILANELIFFGGTCIHGTIPFPESILGVVEIKKGRELIFPVLEDLGN